MMDKPVICPSVMPILESGGLRKLHHMAIVASGIAVAVDVLAASQDASSRHSAVFDRRAEELHGRYLDLACA